MVKKEDSLTLDEDFYSLAFYGYYLEEDEEELCIHSDVSHVKNLISQQTYKGTRAFTNRMSMIGESNLTDLNPLNYLVEPIQPN